MASFSQNKRNYAVLQYNPNIRPACAGLTGVLLIGYYDTRQGAILDEYV